MVEFRIGKIGYVIETAMGRMPYKVVKREYGSFKSTMFTQTVLKYCENYRQATNYLLDKCITMTKNAIQCKIDHLEAFRKELIRHYKINNIYTAAEYAKTFTNQREVEILDAKNEELASVYKSLFSKDIKEELK